MKIVTAAKRNLLFAISGMTGRHAVLLAREARSRALLSVRAAYRVQRANLEIRLNAGSAGTLSAQLLRYRGYFPRIKVGEAVRVRYERPSTFTFSPATGEVRFNGRSVAVMPGFGDVRRFCWKFEHVDDLGHRSRYTTSHYLPESANHDAAYFTGTNYVDYEDESASSHAEIVELLRRFDAAGKVLEVGCATGGLLAALNQRGFDGCGVDISTWAVQKARERAGSERVWTCDVENEPLPSPLVARGPFNAIVMAAVFEHFREPFGVLAKITPLAAPGAVLVVTTTNASSLTRHVFGADWEGYFDASHLGVDRVSVAAIRSELPPLGWRVVHLDTHLAWTRSADPKHATLRDWYEADERFRQLLSERELGDLITCVAIRS